MGKRIISLLIATCFICSAKASEVLFNFKQLGGDSANYSFINRFSDSRVFNCYQNGKVVFGFSVGVPVKSLYPDEGKAIQADHIKKFDTPIDWENVSAYIKFDLGIDTKSGYKRTFNSIGQPLFDSNDSMKYMLVELLNGKKIELSRFGPIPDFPFNTKKKLKPFFSYQEEGGPRYECGAIDQPN